MKFAIRFKKFNANGVPRINATVCVPGHQQHTLTNLDPAKARRFINLYMQTMFPALIQTKG